MALLAGMISWSERVHSDLFDYVEWFVIIGVIYIVGSCSPFCDSYLFKIKIYIFTVMFCFVAIFLLPFCNNGGQGDLFTINLSVLIIKQCR